MREPLELEAIFSATAIEVRQLLKADGLTAIHTLQELNPEVKVIATSRLAANSQVAEEIGSSVKAFLPKPYKAKQLLDTLQKVLNNSLAFVPFNGE